MTYEFQCQRCNVEWEIERRITDDSLVYCPECGSCAVKRLISNRGNFALKGDGWYQDGYSKKASSNEK